MRIQNVISVLSFITLILILSFSFYGTSFADEIRIKLPKSKILYVYDGDTFFIRCKFCKGKRIGVRIKGVDTPEIYGKCDKERDGAIKSRVFTNLKINQGKEIYLVVDDKKQFDYFGRILARVEIDGIDLGGEIILNGFGVIYINKRFDRWCDVPENKELIHKKRAK